MNGNNQLGDLFAAEAPLGETAKPLPAITGSYTLESRELGEAVARRTRSLIAPSPLLELESNKTQRDLDLSRHDLRMLCLVVLDVVIDKMGFGTGATRRDIEFALSPILRTAEPTIAEETERRVVGIILDALLNERGRRQQFVERYAALENGAVCWREFGYRLLEEMQTESGERVFRASSEAIKLYTEMLGYNLEDATEADLAVIKYQSQRGRLDDAIQTARQAQIRAKAYAEMIRLRLEVARRDADQAKWSSEVLEQMTHALGLIRERQRKESELRTGLEQRRDQAGGDDLIKLTRLLDELEKSETTNLELHRLLITANDQFRDEHARQRLRRVATGLRVNLEPEVLLPWLHAEVGFAQEAWIPAMNLLVGHATPVPPSLEQLWLKLLALPSESEAAHADVTAPQTTALMAAPPVFLPADRLAVRDFLRQELRTPRKLSDLLVIADKRGLSASSRRLFVLLTMEQFGAANERRQFSVVPDGASFAVEEFCGDELALSRLTK
ncbi:MAG TPA: hypothetical protein VN873_13680 [Candidatus Angelobacter sp.]|nr:hypothetical protein [Candidatus Angelobacter sp.]